jgi:hypothetical protein
MENMYYIGLDVHKRTISYCLKDASGRVFAEGSASCASARAAYWQFAGNMNRIGVGILFQRSLQQVSGLRNKFRNLPAGNIKRVRGLYRITLNSFSTQFRCKSNQRLCSMICSEQFLAGFQ